MALIKYLILQYFRWFTSRSRLFCSVVAWNLAINYKFFKSFNIQTTGLQDSRAYLALKVVLLVYECTSLTSNHNWTPHWLSIKKNIHYSPRKTK